MCHSRLLANLYIFDHSNKPVTDSSVLVPALVIRTLNLYTLLSSPGGYICSEPWGNMTQLYKEKYGHARNIL